MNKIFLSGTLENKNISFENSGAIGAVGDTNKVV